MSTAATFLFLFLFVASSKARVSSCSIFSTDVVIDFLGDPSNVTENEFELITNNLISVYNSYDYGNSNTCDPLQRQITEAMVDLSKSRLPDETNETSLEKNDFISYFISINLTCCDDRCNDMSTTNLFDAPAEDNTFTDRRQRRQMLRAAAVELPDNNSTSIIVCPQNDNDVTSSIVLELRSPTPYEFTIAFNSSIQTAIVDGALPSIFTLARNVSEVQQVPCGGGEEEGDATSSINENTEEIYVSVKGDLVQAINNTSILEAAFQIAYQNLVDEDCTTFRTVTNADVIGADSSESGFIDSTGGGGGYDSKPELLLDFTLYFRVTFSCFNCERLFLQNDAFRQRRRQRRRELTGRSLQLESNNVCYCDTTSVSRSRQLQSSGAPSIEEFEIEYYLVLQSLGVAFITEITSVSNIPPEYFTCQQAYDQNYCSQFAECIVVGGEFVCSCKYGFQGDGRVCVSFDECQGENLCPSEETGGYCVDYFGQSEYRGYKCGCDPRKGVRDGENVTVHGPTTCVDICEDSSCDENAVCLNQYDGVNYECVCKDRFDGDGFKCNMAPSSEPSQPPLAIPLKEVINDQLDNCLDTDMQTSIMFDNSFQGPFYQGDESTASYSFEIAGGQTRLIISFDAYAYDSWDSAEDDRILFQAVDEYATTIIDFIPLSLTATENASGGTAAYSWSLSSYAAPTKFGGIDRFEDQKHHVSITLFDSQFNPLGGTVTATVGFHLSGKMDESLGVEKFRVVSCLTTLPTNPPTAAPTAAPTAQPTTRPPTPRPIQPVPYYT
mmetsp:Transcript_11323/g.17356  ORF Transcript_11323/g.17356 Transcript_11323/m.17356 type:complete len:781 (+) Transcript_11323:127-2469(+)